MKLTAPVDPRVEEAVDRALAAEAARTGEEPDEFLRGRLMAHVTSCRKCWLLVRDNAAKAA